MNKERIEKLKIICFKQILNNVKNHNSLIQFTILTNVFINLHIKPKIYTNGIIN